MIPKPLRRVFWPLRPYYTSIFGIKPRELEPEPSAHELYPKYLKSNDVVIEVGARAGAGTLYLSKLVSHVYSFEPEQTNFRALRVSTRKLQNVALYRCALSDYSGAGYLNVNRNMRYAETSSLKKLRGKRYNFAEKVKIYKLDQITFEKKPSSLILDCQGSEADVLKGAKRTIDGLRTIIIETHSFADGTDSIDSVLREMSNYQSFDVRMERVDIGNVHEQWIICLSKKSR